MLTADLALTNEVRIIRQQNIVAAHIDGNDVHVLSRAPIQAGPSTLQGATTGPSVPPSCGQTPTGAGQPLNRYEDDDTNDDRSDWL